MNIPRPKLYPVPPMMHGMSDVDQIAYDWEHPPIFELAEDWIIDLDLGVELVFLRGFRTDFATVPRALWPIICPDGPLCIPSIPHDMRYQYGYFLTKFVAGEVYSDAALAIWATFPYQLQHYIPCFLDGGQEFSDKLLKEMTIAISGATVQAEAAYLAVKEFGSSTWNTYRTEGPAAFNSHSLGLQGVTA